MFLLFTANWNSSFSLHYLKQCLQIFTTNQNISFYLKNERRSTQSYECSNKIQKVMQTSKSVVCCWFETFMNWKRFIYYLDAQSVNGNEMGFLMNKWNVEVEKSYECGNWYSVWHKTPVLWKCNRAVYFTLYIN